MMLAALTREPNREVIGSVPAGTCVLDDPVLSREQRCTADPNRRPYHRPGRRELSAQKLGGLRPDEEVVSAVPYRGHEIRRAWDERDIGLVDQSALVIDAPAEHTSGRREPPRHQVLISMRVKPRHAGAAGERIGREH